MDNKIGNQAVSKISKLAENIIGSEIIKLAAEVNKKIKQGEKIFNMTIGDFNPQQFPIPAELKQYIVDEYEDAQTNYPESEGMLDLRQAVSDFLKDKGHLDYGTDEILVSGGARPIIYCIFKTVVDPGDTVVFAVPSWNNNHYASLNNANSVIIEAKAEDNFMPSAKDIAPHIQKVTLIALCSPQNPTGTVFTKEGLEEICDMILAENRRRGDSQKPVYLMYDQIYWQLMMGDTKHYNPVVLRPEMKEYTIFVDGISKSLSATGVRVGWAMGPKNIISKMKPLLSHMGAWAPKAEQLASAKYLNNTDVYDKYMTIQIDEVYKRLKGLYDGFQDMKSDGLAVDAIAPQAAIYLTIQFDLIGKTTESGKVLSSTREITKYILDEAKVAVVPFYAFGTSEELTWFRMSVGTCAAADVPVIISNLKSAITKLK